MFKILSIKLIMKYEAFLLEQVHIKNIYDKLFSPYQLDKCRIVSSLT